MTHTHWLLIGGAGHGETFLVTGSTSFLYPVPSTSILYSAADTIENQHYAGQRYVLGRKCFQIGLHSPTPEQLSQVADFIVQTNLTALGDA